MNQIPQVFLSHASEVLGDTNLGLSGSNIVKAFTVYAVDCNINIPHSRYPFDAPNKKTALLENLLCFKPEMQYLIIRELCNHPNLPNPIPEQVNNLKIQLIARFGKILGNTIKETLSQSLVEDTRTFLGDYPESESLYSAALTKFNNDVFERNLLDDLRLSLELLAKSVLGNEKSLENQIPQIGKFISEKGGSKHFSNMFRTLVSYYTDYQNAFVKHNDAVIEEEIEFIFEMTSSFMKHMAKMHKRG